MPVKVSLFRRSLPAVTGLLLGSSLLYSVAAAAPPAAPVDFDRDVRPILSEKCFACHGFDENKRQAGLRLDTPQGATAKLKSRNVAVVPGNLEASALAKRVSNGSMPPPNSGKTLTDALVATLRRWVAEGGKYSPHWAFVAPQRPPLPEVKNRNWPVNP